MRLYPSVMGGQWEHLPAAIRRAHLSADTLRGRFDVHHGKSRLARLVARLIRCPREAAAMPVTLHIDADGAFESWHRTFGDRRVTTRQRTSEAGVLDEQIGILELRFRLDGDPDALRFRQVGARARLAGLSVPWPRWCRPHVDAVERAEPGGVGVRVTVSLPGVGLLMSYAGHLDVPAAP